MTARAKTTQSDPSALIAETPLGPQPPALVLFGRDGNRPRAAWFAAADAEAAIAAATVMRLRTLSLADDAGRELAAQLARGRVLASGRALVPFVKREPYARLIAMAGEEAGLSVAEGSRADGPAAITEPTADPPTEVAAPATGDGAADPSEVERSPDGEPATGGVAAAPAVAGEPADEPPAQRPGTHLFVGQPRPGDRAEIGLGSVVLAHEGPDDGWWEAEVIGANGRTFSLRWRDYPTQPTILRKADELALLPPGEP